MRWNGLSLAFLCHHHMKRPIETVARRKRGEMKETYRVPSMMFRNKGGGGGMSVLRDAQSLRCAYCGSLRYSLVFRVSEDG